MSLEEVRTWRRYGNKWGVSTLRGVEFGAAVVAQTMGGGAISKYLPDRRDKPVLTPALAMAMMPGTVVKR